ncbi:MAG: AI-2E family transporter [Cytophagia bacterium]|nr:MAG: AI-2E family transporter [Cytophagia bacterium]TAG42233.1 MAG: AI-2E family transporter [Cytophagia bacterium]
MNGTIIHFLSDIYMRKYIFPLLITLIGIWILLTVFGNLLSFLLISVVIASILRPVTDYFSRWVIFGRHFPRGLAVLLALIVLALFPVLFGLLFVPLIAEQISVLGALNYWDIVETLEIPIKNIEKFVIQYFYNDKKEGFLIKEITQAGIKFAENLRLASILQDILKITGSILIYIVSILFITFFLLYEKDLLRRSFLSLVPNAYFEMVVTTLYKIEKTLGNYLLGLLIQISLMFMMMAIGLSIAGIKYALTIAVFLAFINLVPYLGTLIGFLFTIFVIISTKQIENITHLNDYSFMLFKLVLVFVPIVAIDNLITQPFIFSKSVKAHPLEIFMSIFAGATIAGGLGMLLAIPVYTVLRISIFEMKNAYGAYKVFGK